MKSIMRACRYSLGLVLLLSMVGCVQQTRMKAFDVAIGLLENVHDRTVEVDLVGVGGTDLKKWEEVDLADYWDPDNPFRKDYRDMGVLWTHEFPAGGAPGDKEATLLKNDPIWKNWLGDKKSEKHLVIVARIGGVMPEPARGTKNPLMDSLPLAGNRWRTDRIEIKIGLGSGIVVLTPPLPEEK